MKKIVAILLALSLLAVSALALAEEADHFTFRNGVEWDMSAAAVQATEGRDADDGQQESGYATCLYQNVKISKFTGILAYVFTEDALKCIGYQIPAASDADFDYLLNALSKVYGDSAAADLAYLSDVLNTLGGFDYDESDFAAGRGWTLADGTVIDLVQEDGAMVIYYINPNYAVAYNVWGL